MTTYTALCGQDPYTDEQWIIIRIPELDATTQLERGEAYTEEAAEAMARDYIATTLDVDPYSFSVQVHPPR